MSGLEAWVNPTQPLPVGGTAHGAVAEPEHERADAAAVESLLAAPGDD